MKHLGIVTALLLALAVALAGCGGSMEAKLVGKWKGTANLPKDKANDPMAAMAQAMLANISLELKKDKTFV
ncbi:MAG: hypothetical protein HY261_11160, partial [Chloroflexi bacterium]|nr:hypothetical protein [Chloroflexota bacterium]